MKVLFIQNGMHVKNLHALRKYNIHIISINHTNLDTINLHHFDIIYSPACPIDVSKYPNSKFLFGPHFSVVPYKQHMDVIQGNNSIYIQPSEWAKNAWQFHPYCQRIRIETLPFGVDINRFNEIKPISQRTKIFIYFKRRLANELVMINNFLKNNGYEPKIFDYVKKYDENEYINYLHESKFGVWLGAHESQGFALQEALACNVPLLVWNVTSMNQESGSHFGDIEASTIPYWSDYCGENFTNIFELPTKYDKFIQNIDNYKPRDYIVNNLSINKCSEKFIELVNKI
jgi:hypothetical protein